MHGQAVVEIFQRRTARPIVPAGGKVQDIAAVKIGNDDIEKIIFGNGLKQGDVDAGKRRALDFKTRFSLPSVFSTSRCFTFSPFSGLVTVPIVLQAQGG
jgi:hypothetical protein